MEKQTKGVTLSKVDTFFYRCINRLFGLAELNTTRVEEPKPAMSHREEHPALIRGNAGACVSQAYFDEIKK